MKELKFSDINENDVIEEIEEIESLETRTEFSCVINSCPVNSRDCIVNCFVIG